ncbi:MAG: putative porin [Mangrovibacterium sp.]
MIRKLNITIILFLTAILSAMAQFDEINPQGYGSFQSVEQENEDSLQRARIDQRPHIPSVIRTWKLSQEGAGMEKAKLDTSLNFYHVYEPFNQRSIGNTFTGNLGGAYQSNDYFSRKGESDFYFFRAFDAYARFPGSVSFFNTTTPYSLLDYSQSENKNTRNETRFNVYHSQNASPGFNFAFLWDQAKSMGQYQCQETKYNTIGLTSSYVSDRFNSHFSMLLNRHESQENGGLQSGQDLNEYNETETYLVNLVEADSKIRNNTFILTSEYKVGKTVETENEDGVISEEFRPITGFIHQIEYSGNKRFFSDEEEDLDYFRNTYRDNSATRDTASYSRLTNIFQLKFYETPRKKFSFSPRAFLGYENVTIKIPGAESSITQKDNYHNLFVGGGISREEGQFWKWNANGRIYLTGFKSGQTELKGRIYKPMRIGRDTTSFSVAAELNTLVPDYFIQDYRSNHFEWTNRFDNTNEIILRSKISSQTRHLDLGVNYTLITNPIYNDSLALPNQGSRELMVLSAYANKDIASRHWLLRAQLLWQTCGEEDYLHLPALTGYLSVNYRTIVSKVMHAQLGFDVRYHTEFYADAWEPATGRFYWQEKQKIGNYPFVDLHASLKLKRTRAFFLLKNAASGLLSGDFWSAPDYPLYRRTFRLGIAWSFYD